MRILLAFAMLCLAVASAHAQRAPQIARVGPERATSSCVGQSTSPQCAVDTLLACIARHDGGLCQRIGVVAPRRDNSGPLQIEYSIEQVSVIRPEDVTDDTRDLVWYKPGYTLVEGNRRQCAADQATCDAEEWQYLQVALRRVDGAWEVVYWNSDSESETAPELPDGYQRPEPPAN